MGNPLEITFIFLSYLSTILLVLGRFIISLWWVYLPVLLLVIIRGLRMKYTRSNFVKNMEWVLLEITPPREVKKTPKAIEQFFYVLHASQRGPNWKERIMQGMTQSWFSLEMISREGEIHFLIRTQVFFRDLVESQIYAQYPDAEIKEAVDYVDSISQDDLDKDYNMWGTELQLIMDDAYPIKTYPEFEKDILVEEQRIDPLSSLLEVMGKIREGEHIWIQTLVRAVDDEWKKEADKLKDKLLKREAPAKKVGIIRTEVGAFAKEQRAQLEVLATGKRPESVEEKKQEQKNLAQMTKTELETVAAIERSISKFGYETIIRFLYIARTDNFNMVNVPAVIGSYKQFGSQNMNGFKPNKKVTTGVDYEIQLKKYRVPYRKRKLLMHYQQRFFEQHSKYIDYLKPFFFEKLPILNWFLIRSKPFILSTEELATIYHFPSEAVKAPLIPKIEAKKGEPPIGLPME
ncbi:MAG: hypothetical protein ABH887_02050 [bacterium]